MFLTRRSLLDRVLLANLLTIEPADGGAGGGGGGGKTEEKPDAKGADDKAGEKPDDKEPAWLPARLERERSAATRAILKELGITDVADGKAAIDDLKKRREADKSELDKAREQKVALDKLDGSHKAALGVLTNRLAIEMKSLTDEQRAAVDALAGDDPVKALSAIDTLRPTWAKQAATGEGEGEKKPDEKKAATAPPRTAPPQGGAGGGKVDHKAIYEQLKETNPIAAAHYANQHVAEIYPQTK